MELISNLIQSNPKATIIGFSALMALFISIVNYFVLDKERMSYLKQQQKALQEKLKNHQKEGNHDAMMELNKEMLSNMSETIKHSFKPTLITIVPVLIFFNFIKNSYALTSLESSWFWWYLVSVVIFSIIFRKVLRLP
jgi:uncharacterized membrane protein (DUF106 family)